MNKEKMFYEKEYLQWIKCNQKHARELEKENAEMIFKKDQLNVQDEK